MFVKFKKLILIISGSILSFTLFYLIGLLITQIIFRWKRTQFKKELSFLLKINLIKKKISNYDNIN